MTVWGDVRSALGLDEPRRPARTHRGRPGPKHAPRVPFAVLVVTLIAGGMGLLLLLNTASAANEVRRHDLAAQDAGVAAQVQELENEVAASSAPGNLAQAAAALGMVPAGNPAFLVVGADGKVRVMGHPAPVSGAAVAKIPAKTSRSTKPKTTATPTKAAKSSKTATSTRTSTNARTKTASNKSAGPSTGMQNHAAPTPTPTPTPTVTLPGGNR